MAISRTDHIHARIGHTQAAQIPDPRAPEWEKAIDYHLKWWDKIIETHKQKGTEVFTICPEFGPYPYMPEIPFSRQPVADLWEVNLYIRDLLNKRYLTV